MRLVARLTLFYPKDGRKGALGCRLSPGYACAAGKQRYIDNACKKEVSYNNRFIENCLECRSFYVPVIALEDRQRDRFLICRQRKRRAGPQQLAGQRRLSSYCMRRRYGQTPYRYGEAIVSAEMQKLEEMGMYVYCLFCETVKCRGIAEAITDRFHCRAISPKQIQHTRSKGRQMDIEHDLLPGYVFVYDPESNPLLLVW